MRPKQALVSALVVVQALALALCAISCSYANPVPSNADLSSTTPTIAAPFSGTIVVGGESRPITAGTLLTPAEYVALLQGQQGGQQVLQIDSGGAAIGGTVYLPPQVDLSSLVVPQGVTALVGSTNQPAQAINVDGMANIGGSLVMQAADSSLKATSVLVGQTGVLSNVLNSQSALLTITALNNLTNAGIISSSGSINLNVGGTLANSGLIQAQSGSVNINGTTTSFNLQNIGGTISAPLGAVNVSALNGAALSVLGGIIQAQNVNFLVAQGALNLAVDGLLGSVSIKARDIAASVLSDLNIASLDLSGDPIFNVAGAFTGPGGIFAGEDFIVTASGDITITSDINTSSSTGEAGTVMLVSGGSILLHNPSTMQLVNIAANGVGSSGGGDVTLLGRNAVTAGNISANGTGQFGSGGGVYVSANGDINVGNITATGDASTGLGGAVLLTTAVSGGSGTINVGTIDVSGASPGVVQQFTPSSPPLGLLDTAFANGGALTIVPSQLPGGGFTSFANAGTITLATDGAGVGFGRVNAPFFVTGAANLGDVSGIAQELWAVGTGDVAAGNVRNSASGAAADVAGDISLVSTGGNVSLVPTVSYNLGSDEIVLVHGSSSNKSTIGNLSLTPALTLSTGTIISRGGGTLEILAGSGGINMTGAMTGNTSIDGDGPVVVQTGGTLTLGGGSPLVINAQGLLSSAGGFAFGVLLAGSSVAFGGGGARTINVAGTGLQLFADTSFSDLGNTNLAINVLSAPASLGDVIVASGASLSNTPNGSITVSIPAGRSTDPLAPPAGGLTLASENGDADVQDISVSGGYLNIAALNHVTVSGEILARTTNPVNGGIVIESGLDLVGGSFPPQQPAPTRGITVSPNTLVRADGGHLVLSVVFADVTPPGGGPMILVDSGASLVANGFFNGGDPVGGGIQLSVTPDPFNFPFSRPSLQQLVEQQRSGDQPPNQGPGFGVLQIDGDPIAMDTPLIIRPFRGGTLQGSGNGIIRLFERGVPGSINLTGSTLFANSGAVLIDVGGTYPDEIMILGASLEGGLPFSFSAPPPEAPSPPPPPPPLPPPAEPGPRGPDPVITPKDQNQFLFQPADTAATQATQATATVEQYQQPPQHQLFISTVSCTPISFATLKDSYLQGETGAMFEVAEEQTIFLKEGRLFAGAGENGLRFATREGEISMKPYTVVMLDGRQGKPLRVTVLDGDSADPVSVRYRNDTLAVLEPGQEAVVADKELSEEELIAVDGVEREPIGGTIFKAGKHVLRNRVPVAQVLKKDPLLRCCFGIYEMSKDKEALVQYKQVCGLSWPSRRLAKRYGRELIGAAGSPGTSGTAAPRSPGASAPRAPDAASFQLPQAPYEFLPWTGNAENAKGRHGHALVPEPARPAGLLPVSHIEAGLKTPHEHPGQFVFDGSVQPGKYILAAGGAWVRSPVRTSADYGLKMGPGSRVLDLGNDSLKLASGAVLVHPRRALRVHTPHGVVSVKPYCAAIVKLEDSLTRVLDLSDTSLGGVRVLAGKRSVDLAPGMEATIVKGSKLDPKQLIFSDSLGRRRMQVYPVSDDLRVVVNEFSLVDALTRHPLVSGLRASREQADKALFSKVVKTAAAVAMSIGRGRGIYSASAQNEARP